MASKSRESDKAGTVAGQDGDDAARTTSFGGAARYVRASWGLPDVVIREPEAKGRMSRRLVVTLASLGVAAVMVAGALVYHFACVVPSGVALDDTTFPDAAFRDALAAFDEDGNGRISVEEASHVSSLSLEGLGIADLTGIGAFTHLENLDVSDNDLTGVDLSGCKALVTLDVSDNEIASLDLTGLSSLETLDAHGNGMQTLEIRSCASLRDLDVEGNSLARLDLSGCAAMERLNMDEGQEVTLPLASAFFPDEGLREALASFDADGDGALSARERQAVHSLEVHDSSTTSLEGLEWFDNLQDLDVSGTQLDSLGPDTLPQSLTSLRASGCGLTSVDLSGTTRIASVDLSDNAALEQIDPSALPRLTNANLANCGLAGTLDVSANTRLEHIDVSGNPSLATLNAQGVPGLAAEGAVVADDTCMVVLDAAVTTAVESGTDAQEGDEATSQDTGEGNTTN